MKPSESVIDEPAKDLFRWRNLSIAQNDHVFRIGTDAILLASWIPRIITHCHKVLDVGTGTGVLALAVKSKFPDAMVHAIDSNKEAVALANFNFSAFNRSKDLSATLTDLFEADGSFEGYDLICCNPPYYFGQLRNQSKNKIMARHAEVDIDQWMSGLTNCSSNGGSICMIVPFDKAFQWIRAGNQHGYYCTDRLDVYSGQLDDLPIRSLLHFNQRLAKLHTDRMTIYDIHKNWTAEYLSFSGIDGEQKKSDL